VAFLNERKRDSEKGLYTEPFFCALIFTDGLTGDLGVLGLIEKGLRLMKLFPL